MNREHQHRLFFALWPSGDVRQAIQNAFELTSQSHLKGRKMRIHNLHMTLHFIGNVSAARMTCLGEAAATIQTKGFTLTLDRFGFFYRPGVLWLGSSTVPDELKMLYTSLGRALLQCEYVMDERPYAPHVTLMRKLSRPGVLPEPEIIHWPVSEFVLVESMPDSAGVRYEVRQSYSLCSDQG